MLVYIIWFIIYLQIITVLINFNEVKKEPLSTDSNDFR